MSVVQSLYKLPTTTEFLYLCKRMHTHNQLVLVISRMHDVNPKENIATDRMQLGVYGKQ